MKQGFPVVLTADRTLMSEYNGGIFLGFSACIPRGLIPDSVYFSLFCPSVKADKNGVVEAAPYGTRKIEAALLENGFSREEVIVAHPDRLDRVIGPKTKVIGITENDPLGIGPATSTFTQIFGGEAYMAVKFRELLRHPSIRRFKPKIIVGGPGAWQLENEELRRELGIDCVVIGEGEKVAPSLFEKALNGEELPGVVYGETASIEDIPTIKGAAVDGLVEVARGCGRGCRFCVPTLQLYRCLPIDRILKEVEVNIKAGRNPILHAEDVLRYGAKGIEVNREAVINLFKAVKGYPGVERVGISHFALASVASAPEVIEEISDILGIDEKNWFSGQTGIETGSPELIEKLMRGKCKPFTPEEWPEVVLRAFEILSENNWVPCATLILGLPGEKERDLEATVDLIEELRPFKSLIVPLFLVATGGLKGKAASFGLEEMGQRHSEVFLKCWEHNLDWGPTLIKEWTERNLRNPIARHGVKLILSYAIKQGRRLIDRCKKEYDYDLKAMIEDLKSERVRATPITTRFLYRLLS